MIKNIFQRLGLSETHRPAEKTTMKVKHFDEVPGDKHLYPAAVQEKKDGLFALVLVHGDQFGTFSRTGKAFTNLYDMSYNFYLKAKADAIYIAELCNDHCSLEELSGLVNPNRKAPLTKEQEAILEYCYFAFHDYLPIGDFIRGRSSLVYSDRLRHLWDTIPAGYDVLFLEPFAFSDEEVQAIADQKIKDGCEGVVVKPDHKWVAGHKGYRMMKLVRGVDYDLLCVGLEEGTGKYSGKVANLIFRWKDGKTIKAMLGKGWTHYMAEKMWQDQHVPSLTPIGKVFKVHALQESSKGKLRLPKVLEERIDKTEPDV